jgi:hypothetical protein
MFIFIMVFTKKKALQIFTYMKIPNKFMQNLVSACFPRIVHWSHFTMSNPIDAKAQIRMSMCPYSLIVSFSLHGFLGHLHSGWNYWQGLPITQRGTAM